MRRMIKVKGHFARAIQSEHDVPDQASAEATRDRWLREGALWVTWTTPDGKSITFHPTPWRDQ